MIRFDLHRRLRAALLLAGLLVALPGGGSADSGSVDPAAAERLRASLAYVAGLEHFSLRTANTIEAVLASGQKLQFDSVTSMTLQRPNRLHALRVGDVESQELFYDGETVTLLDVNSGFFATAAAPPTLEGMLDFARESLDLVAPAGDLLYRNAFDLLMQEVVAGFIVGTSLVNGIACDHLAFSQPDTDWQVWLEQGERPLPRKLVITSRDVPGAPQFSVTIDEWNLNADIAPQQFLFTPPEGAVAIEFLGLETDED